MPVTKSARKKMRQDIKRRQRNKNFKLKLKSAVKRLIKTANFNNFKQAQSLIDRAVKRGIFKKNKAARLKSKLSKLLLPTNQTKQAVEN